MDTEDRYSLPMRVMHWLVGLLIIGMIAVGWYMGDLPKDDPLRATLYALHKSFGVIALLLAILRLSIRLASTVPALPSVSSVWEKRAAHAMHTTLYCLILAMPLSGYLMTNAYGYEVMLFSMPLPKLIGADRALAGWLNDAHGVLGYGLLALIALHVAAVAKYWMVDKTNILKRMW